MREVVRLVCGIDVEEEGLFAGRYQCRSPSLKNIASLQRLVPFLERGLRPTLFCAHCVLTDRSSCRTLEGLRQHGCVEVAAHLHHWNTPPLDKDCPDWLAAVPAGAVPPPQMAAKLTNLFRAGQDFLGEPVRSFRMGRWDMHRAHWPLLEGSGVLNDASVRPLHGSGCAERDLPSAPPDHFHAPGSPYWIPCNKGRIFELPLTVTPLVAGLPRLFSSLSGRWGARLRAGLRHWGALTLLPVEHPLWAMQAVTRLSLRRQGRDGARVLSLTWHSSEMMPGGTPHLPDEAAVSRFLARVGRYLDWLGQAYEVRYLTLDELRQEWGDRAITAPCGPGDWRAV